ncbi:hypothetical protein PPL_06876 [Heterostelium album PN500]|uniref:Pesticidal crystal protein domain-containing protein n=1 Tax=Heterostelium pallidum (strain ATCC 26659 / Pp 5 / PN500) TaxID=670386 RepID=D3BDS3_HETP5|nr:hypothetical protein PPL_06876 [Heterostelium album PN500]EFA80054.1 hypothetical protein PPL_06876 [Heterostelium album PN500]|eukprot:XP_020432174.1 hypothetical protein PPL_06876 [Heterostelium album PN500]
MSTLSLAGKQKILTFAGVFRSNFADSFGNFLEKSTTGNTPLVVNLANGNETINARNWAILITNILAGALAAIPGYGPALCAGSLLVLNIIFSNVAVEDDQNREIYDILERSNRKLVGGWNQSTIRGASTLLEQLLQYQLIVQQPPNEAEITKMKSLTDLILSFFSTHSEGMLLPGYEVISLPDYAAFITIHLKFLEDITLRSTYYKLSSTDQRYYMEQYSNLHQKYLDRIREVYNMGLNEIFQKYPEKRYEAGDYNALFNHIQNYRNFMIIHVFDMINMSFNVQHFGRPFDFINPRPLYSKVFCKTSLLVYNMSSPVLEVDHAAMDIRRMSANEIAYYLSTERSGLYVSDIRRIMVNADNSNIYSLQNDYSDNSYSKKYGSPDSGQQQFLAIPSGSFLFVNQIPIQNGGLKFIGTTGNNMKIGATDSFTINGSELVDYGGNRIGRITGIERSIPREPNLYGMVCTFFPNNVTPFTNLNPNLVNVINGTKIDYMTPFGNYELLADYQNIGMDALNARNYLFYNIECQSQPTEFMIQIQTEKFTPGFSVTIRESDQDPSQALTFNATSEVV